ncbi:MAG: thiamine biosynthesis protein ApbE [Porphyromonadaceae bacterium CG2_30_38_12]|nr:MAG: thiamine biosynthesis protein ApbE [Porphyromonadaceae bacterium CG2_30_38_12]
MIAEKEILKLMGCRFEITATAKDKKAAQKAIEVGIAEIQRIENLISEWDSATQTSAINKMAGIAPVKVDKELFDLIYRCNKISGLTQGAFDISFASMDKIWNFDKNEHDMPDNIVVKEAAKHINWEKIILNAQNNTVFLQEKGMKIGFGAIGKGYSANKAKVEMQKIPGVLGGIVNASGDLLTWGVSNNPSGWSIQIADPKNINKPLAWLQLNNISIVTSGDYEKYFSNNGKRYSHIINPKTGYPITDIKSVTIICPDAELSDALATSICVLGVSQGIELINKLNEVECLIVDANDKIHTSDKLQLNYYK